MFQSAKVSEDWPGMRVLLQLTSQPVNICEICRKDFLASGGTMCSASRKHGKRLRNKLFDSQPLVIQPFCAQDNAFSNNHCFILLQMLFRLWSLWSFRLSSSSSQVLGRQVQPSVGCQEAPQPCSILKHSNIFEQNMFEYNMYQHVIFQYISLIHF